jgi:low affinity Fe/Cu permease
MPPASFCLRQGNVMPEAFRKFAHAIANVVGAAGTFIVAVGVVLAWAATGPFFGFSDTWQLVINTSTTIVTFLMVFLIQNSQNRDARALHLKLDELLRAVGGARTSLVNLESLSDTKLLELQQEFERLQKNFGIDGPHLDHISRELKARERDLKKQGHPHPRR